MPLPAADLRCDRRRARQGARSSPGRHFPRRREFPYARTCFDRGIIRRQTSRPFVRYILERYARQSCPPDTLHKGIGNELRSQRIDLK